MDKAVRVGVGVLVLRGGKLLLGLRKSSHGAGTWHPPGGHLEFGEDVAGCARRELAEETGLLADGIRRGPWTNDIFHDEGKHYVSLFMIVEEFSGAPRVMEPGKCERWDWFDLRDLPAPLFLPLANLVKDESFIESLVS